MVGNHRRMALTRRAVSDPLVMRKGGESFVLPIRTKGGPPTLPEISDPVPSDNCPDSAKHKLPSNLAAPLPTETDEDARQPEYIDTSCLQPQSQKTKEGRVSILRNGHVIVDSRDSPGTDEMEGKVMVIDSKKDRVSPVSIMRQVV